MPRNPQVVNEIPVACFAPPLTDETLERYAELAEAEGGETGAIMAELLACVRAWWELPESTRTDGDRWTFQQGTGGPAVTVAEVPLEEGQVKELWDVTPWMRELNTLSTEKGAGPLDSLPLGELRDAAFHLLWHCKEITLDREPLTQDKLPEAPKAAEPEKTRKRKA
jgi:hypothetical protein